MEEKAKALKVVFVDGDVELGSIVCLGGGKISSSSPFSYVPTAGGISYSAKPTDFSKTLEERQTEKEAEIAMEKEKYSKMGYDLHYITYPIEAKTFNEIRNTLPELVKEKYEEIFGKLEATKENQHITNPYPIEEKQTIFERVKNLKVFSGMKEYIIELATEISKSR